MIVFIILVIVVIVIVVAYINAQKEKERQENRRSHDYSDYSRIIADLKNWNDLRLTSFFNDLNTEYNNLRVSMQKPTGACKAIMWTSIGNGEFFPFSVDIEGINYLKKYVIEEMRRRGIA